MIYGLRIRNSGFWIPDYREKSYNLCCSCIEFNGQLLAVSKRQTTVSNFNVSNPVSLRDKYSALTFPGPQLSNQCPSTREIQFFKILPRLIETAATERNQVLFTQLTDIPGRYGQVVPAEF